VSTEAEFPRSLSPAKDFNRARRRCNVESLGGGVEEEVGEKGEVEEVLPDGRLDHPTSTENAQYDDADQEIARGVTGHGSEELDTGFVETDRIGQQTAGQGLEEPDEDNRASSVEDEEVLYRETQIAPMQDASDYVSTGAVDTNEWADERQRPTRTARRPARFLDRDFETQFRPEERRKRCSRLGRGEATRQDVDKPSHSYKHTRKKACFDRGRGETSRKTVRRTRLVAADRLISPDQQQQTVQNDYRPLA